MQRERVSVSIIPIRLLLFLKNLSLLWSIVELRAKVMPSKGQDDFPGSGTPPNGNSCRYLFRTVRSCLMPMA